MTKKRERLPLDTSEQKSDPDALQAQEASLKEQGDALDAELTARKAKGPLADEEPRHG